MLYRDCYLLTAKQIVRFNRALLQKPVRASLLFEDAPAAIVSILSLCSPRDVIIHVQDFHHFTVYPELHQLTFSRLEYLYTDGELYLERRLQTFPCVRYLHLELTWSSLDTFMSLKFETATTVTHLWLQLPGRIGYAGNFPHIAHDLTFSSCFLPPPSLRLLLLQSADDGSVPVSWKLVKNGTLGPNAAIVLTEWDVLSADEWKYAVDFKQAEDVWKAGEQVVSNRYVFVFASLGKYLEVTSCDCLRKSISS
ncbi:hypothetical protein GYMLUDRAFT_59396 [Collybiopsis luxurians FD-317 M1]|uniref:Uncharacterized protein n=1 Tax=Collybiopsis luxurians FD-317 M1 TaxID=944289 RepID=A0A0D0BY46_9AGAR|nr:hypothetical protein GYMLUDRAFT_59396 [Collybiopsis luxurians FD-317 M1]